MHKFFKRTNLEDAASSSSQNRRRVQVEEINFAELPADPGLRIPIKNYHPNIQDAVRRAYLQKGPYQPRDHGFPQTKIGDKYRRFNKAWFEEYKDWLEYSIKEDAAFCLYCYLFKPDRGEQAGGETFVTKGFKNWKSKSCLDKHVGNHNSSHNQFRRSCEELMNPKDNVIKLEKGSEYSQIEYRICLNASIKAIRFLLSQGLSIRGYDESEGSLNRGNFLELLKFLGKYNEEIKNVVLQNTPESLKLISPQIRKEIVNACATETSNAIAKEIGSSFFSIIVEKSCEVSVNEQMVIVVRFVNDGGHVIERFLGVVEVHETSAATLKKDLVVLLDEHGLSLTRLRGQSYDGVTNTRDEFNELKALILSENESAHYVHCFVHPLHLALVDVVKNHSPMASFFLNISSLSTVIKVVSCNCPEILRGKEIEKIVEALDAGEISSGRGLINVIVLYSSVIEVLEIVEENDPLAMKGEAERLLNELYSFEFVICLHLMKEILGVTNNICQALQRKDQDIVNAINLVKVGKQRLQEMRNEGHGWDSILNEVSKFCEKHEIDVPNMDDIYEAQSRRRAERITNLHHYRVQLFCTVIDVLSQELDNRFNEMNMELLVCMSCLNPIHSFAAFNKMKLIRLAEFYPKEFSQVDLMMLDHQLETFIMDVRQRVGFSDLEGIDELAKKMVKERMHIVYSLVYPLLTLVLTLPVAAASVERASSVMKIIKSGLCNEIEEEWLNDALVTYIERDVFETIDNEVIINRLQNMKII